MSFTEKNLVPNAGLLPAAALAQRIGLGELVDQRLRLARQGASSGAKALTVIGTMLAQGDSIEDTAVLRAGATGNLFDDARAPSTVGSWLRAQKWSNVRQLDAVSRELLARLWATGAGPDDLAAPLTIDLDSSIVEVYGRAKQGAAFGYTRVRSYHPQFATSTEIVLFSRLRGGSASAARGAKSNLGETVRRVRDTGATAQLTIRADSAFYSRAVLGTAVKLGVDFSVTAQQDKMVRAAIEAIDDQAWTPIPYWLSTPEVSGADVAETSYTAFAATEPIEVRLDTKAPPDQRAIAGSDVRNGSGPCVMVGGMPQPVPRVLPANERSIDDPPFIRRSECGNWCAQRKHCTVLPIAALCGVVGD